MRSHHHPRDYGTKLPTQASSILTFVVFLLSFHPGVFKRLRAEVLEIIGPAERPTHENIQDMKYLCSVLNGRLLTLSTVDQYEHTLNRDSSYLPTSVRPLRSSREYQTVHDQTPPPAL